MRSRRFLVAAMITGACLSLGGQSGDLKFEVASVKPSGTFDIDMKWTPDRMPSAPPGATPELAQALRSTDPNGPSLFTALQEQLGL